MGKLLNLIHANFHKEKGQLIVFFFIMFVAGLLLNVGMITKFHFERDYDKGFERDHAAAAVMTMNQDEYKPEYMTFIENYEGVIESEKRDIITINGEILFQDSYLEQKLLVDDIENPRNIAQHKLIEKLEIPAENAVYLPYIMKTSAGLSLGDTFKLRVNRKPYEYTVAGFYEDYNTGRYSFGYMGISLSHKSYEALEVDNQYIYDSVILMARLEDLSKNEKFYTDLQRYILIHKSSNEESMKGFSATQVKANTMTNAMMLIVVVIAFALIVMIISLIIIKFKISHTIQEEIQDIGALKAIGYTNKELVLVYTVQFGGIALAASFLGVVATIFILPSLRKILTVNAGIRWEQSIDPIIGVIVVLAISGIAGLVAMLTAGKLKETEPIIALRGGMTGHNHKKNRLPLDQSMGNLHFLLAIKSMLQMRYHNLMITLTIASVSFISVFSLVLYQNMAVDNSRFVDMISGEFSSIRLTIGEEGKYNAELKAELMNQEGVRKVSFYDLFGNGNLDNGRSIKIFLSENFDDVENKKCYEGRDPQFDNEIVLNGYLASQIGKKVGDTIVVLYGENAGEYLITGLMQSGNSDGSEAELTIEGYWRINPDYEMKTINVYTQKNRDVNEILAKLEEQFNDTFSHYMNMDESIASMTKNFSQMSVVLVWGIIIITAFVVLLIIYLSIKTTIISQKQDIGVKKAIGFTTFQLRMELTLSLLPVVAIGIVFGSVLCSLTVNSLISVLMRSIGIMRAQFVIPVGLIVMLGIATLAFTFMIALRITKKIKEISAYKLIIE